MTDKELVMELIQRVKQRIVYNEPFDDGMSIGIENAAIGENICFDFNKDGKIIRIFS